MKPESQMTIEAPALYDELMGSRYAEQIAPILAANFGDIDESFLCFDKIYSHLASIIPERRTVIDFGCAYAFQGWYFRNHKEYIGVDPTLAHRHLITSNGSYFPISAESFLREQWPHMSRPNAVFAICNYVPPWYGQRADELVRATFDQCFVFYPDERDHDRPRPFKHKEAK